MAEWFAQYKVCVWFWHHQHKMQFSNQLTFVIWHISELNNNIGGGKTIIIDIVKSGLKKKTFFFYYC